MLKAFTKKVVARALQNEFVWKLFDGSINRVSRFAQWARESGGTDELMQRAIQSIAPDLVVRHGPFQGMR